MGANKKIGFGFMKSTKKSQKLITPGYLKNPTVIKCKN
jgi:hypothetical protein